MRMQGCDKRGRGVRWSNKNIPSEIWREILSYLPAKSLVRFRSVSKTWRFIINEPDFAALHLKRHTDNSPEPLIIVGETVASSICRWALRCSATYQEISEIKFPLDDFHDCDINGTRDGLLLLQKCPENDIVLWNPSIRKSLNIPPPPLPLHTDGHNKPAEYMAVLGFDPSCDDYKVVTFIRHRGHCGLTPYPWPSFQVFSLKDRSWAEVACSADKSSPNSLIHRYWINVSIGEYIHWLAQVRKPVDSNPSGYVVSLNLITMTIVYNPLPVPLLSMWNPYFLNDSLMRLVTGSRIWILEGLDPAAGKTCAKWSKMYQLDERVTHGNCRGLHLRNDGLLLLLRDLYTVYVYDVKTSQTKIVASTTMCPMSVHKHIESLVLLNCE